jgi:hypothetical protein
MPAAGNFNTSSHDQSAVAAKANWLVCAFVLLLFVVAATLSAIRKDVTLGFDEVAHASYVAHLQHSGETWPAFEDMRMLDPSSFGFTSDANYLDHPSPYVLLARIGPTLEGHPEAILFDRLINVLLVAIGLAALMAVGLVAKLPRNLPYPRYLQLWAAYRVRLADNRLPALLFAASGHRSTRGVVIAGRHQAADRPRHAACLPDWRSPSVPLIGGAIGIGSRRSRIARHLFG